MALFWVDCKIGVDAVSDVEARTKVGRILLEELQEDFNWIVSFNIKKDLKYKSLQELRIAQKGKGEF